MKNELFIDMQFCSWIVRASYPQFLSTASKILEENLKNNLRIDLLDDDLFTHKITHNIVLEENDKELADYLTSSAWKILNDQGYDLTNLQVLLSGVFGQSHYRGSGQEQHIHNENQITAFYFIEVPKNSCRLIFHDPRPGKVASSIPLRKTNEFLSSSENIEYNPKPGDVIYTNSWLPHTITRNLNDQPFKFFHISFNLGHKQPMVNNSKSSSSGFETVIV
jgi:uncharacterized protein (TIGR02466 family)